MVLSDLQLNEHELKPYCVGLLKISTSIAVNRARTVHQSPQSLTEQIFAAPVRVG